MVEKEDKTKKFLEDPEVAIFDELQDLGDKVETAIETLKNFDIAPLAELKKKYKIPIKGVDFFTPKDIEDIIKTIQSKIKLPDLDEIVTRALSRIRIPEDGYTPQKGKDYFDGENGTDGEHGKTPIKYIDYFTPQEQEELQEKIVKEIKKLIPEPLNAKEIKEKIESLQGEERLDVSFLKGWEKYLQPQIIQAQGKNKERGIWQGSANPFSVIVSGQVAKDVRSITFIDVTMTNRNGDVTIDTSGSGLVTSVFGRTGAITAQSGDYTTAQVTESGNLYFTNARAIAATLTGYASSAGTISSADSILSAIQKLNGNIGALVTGVSSVSNSDGTLTISPNTGAVVASRAAITGDISIAGGSNASVLATVNSNVGTFGSATQSTQITVNGKGLITAIANITITPAVGSITGLGTNVATALGVNVGSAGAFITFNGNAGTPSALVGTNISGTAANLTAGTVTTNANLTGDVTSVGNATTIGTAKVTLAMMANMATSSLIYRKTAGTGVPEVNTLATLKTDLLLTGTNSGDQTITLTGGVTGSGTGSFAATVVTNANLTGPITSVGNATSIASQTGTGTKFVMDTAPTIVGGLHTAITTLGIRDTSAAFDVTLAAVSSTNLTAGRILTLDMGNVAHTLIFGTTAGNLTFPLGTKTIPSTADNLSVFAATTSAQLAGVISDETGSGLLVFGTSPTLTNPTISGNITMSTSTPKILATSLVIQDATSGQRGTLRVMPNGTVAAVPAALQFFGTDFSADATNYEGLSIFSKGSSDTSYIIRIEKGGTGTVRPLYIYTDPNTTQLVLNTSGNIGIGTATTPSLLTVAGLINMKNYTVATLPAGTRGDIAYVTDALAPGFLTVIVGGGAVVAPVFFNGANWVAM